MAPQTSLTNTWVRLFARRWTSRETIQLMALVVFCLLGTLTTGISWASDDTWPSEELPPISDVAQPTLQAPQLPPMMPQTMPEEPIQRPNLTGIPTQGLNAEMPGHSLSPAKPVPTDANGKKLGFFGKLKRVFFPKKETPPVAEEVITQVGPREAPSHEYPLVVLPMAIANIQGERIKPGFYGASLKAVSPGQFALQLVRENKSQLDIPVTMHGPSIEPVQSIHPGMSIPAKGHRDGCPRSPIRLVRSPPRWQSLPQHHRSSLAGLELFPAD